MRSVTRHFIKQKESEDQMKYYRRKLAQNDLQMRELEKSVSEILNPNHSITNSSPFSSRFEAAKRQKELELYSGDHEQYFLHSGVTYSPKGKILIKRVENSRFSRISSNSSSQSSPKYSRTTKPKEIKNSLTPTTEINLGEEEDESEVNQSQSFSQNSENSNQQMQLLSSNAVYDDIKEEEDSEESLSFLYQGQSLNRFESKDSLFVAAGSMENLLDRSVLSSASQQTLGHSSISGQNNENAEEDETQQKPHLIEKYVIKTAYDLPNDISLPEISSSNQTIEEDEESESGNDKPEEHRFTQFSSSFEEDEPEFEEKLSERSTDYDASIQNSDQQNNIEEESDEHREEEIPSSDISRSDDNEEEEPPENPKDDVSYAIEEEDLHKEEEDDF